MNKKSLDEIFNNTTSTSTPQTNSQFSLGKTIANIPSSGFNLAKNLYSSLRHPVETVKAVGQTALGGIQKLIPGEQKSEQKFDAVANFFKDRYGGTDKVLKTIQEDPVGFALDVSTIFTGAGALLKGAGTVSKASSLTKLGQTASKIGKTVEPISLATKGIGTIAKPLAKGITKLGQESLGISTGAGGDVIKSAFQAGKTGSKEFTEALRGKTSKYNIVTAAREGLNSLKDSRASEYVSKLKKVKNSTKKLDTTPIIYEFKNKLSDYGIKIGVGNKLNFKNSVIGDSSEAKRIQSVLEEAIKWKDKTPAGLDTLKRRLGDFYTPSGQGRALTTSLEKGVADLLKKKVPGYEEMVKGYQSTSELIKEIESTLSLGPKVNADTVIRKLIGAMKSDTGVKQSLIKTIDDLTKVDLEGAITGASLSGVVPSGLIGRSIFAGAGGVGLAGIAGIGSFNPALLSGLVFSSPRVVGEFLRILGLSSNKVEKITSLIEKTKLTSPEIRMAGGEVGQIKGINQQKKKTLEEIFGNIK